MRPSPACRAPFTLGDLCAAGVVAIGPVRAPLPNIRTGERVPIVTDRMLVAGLDPR